MLNVIHIDIIQLLNFNHRHMATRDNANKLALRGEFLPQQAWAQIEALTTKLQGSGALPTSIKNGSQLAMVLLAGYEAGMTPMESINSYYIVNGKVTIWGSAVLVQLRRAGYKIRWVKSDDKVAEAEISKGTERHVETYTIDEAKASGLLTKDTWMKYPKEMLRHKTIGRAVRFFCPEVLGGFYMKEEIEAEDIQATEIHRADIEVQPVEVKDKLPEVNNKAIHASWHELSEVHGWEKDEAEGRRKATLKALYKVESNNDLTVEQAQDFVRRTNDATKRAKDEKAKAGNTGKSGKTQKANETAAEVKAEVVENPAENPLETAQEVAEAFGGKVIETCKTCNKEFYDNGDKTGDAEAIRFAGECNACLNGKA